VYDTIQGGYEDITKEDFDGVWDGGQHSQIYEVAFKRYLADIVEQINSTADGTSNPQEAVTIIRHVRTSKPKAQGRQPKSLTKEEVLTLIVKTSASVHSFETPEEIRKAIRGALKGQKNVDKYTEQLLGRWLVIHGKSSKKDAQKKDAVRNEESMEDAAEGHSNDDASMEDGDETEDDAERDSNDVPMPDAGAGDAPEEQDYMTLPELAAKYPSFVLKQDWAPASRSVSPETDMIAILLHSLDPRRVTDHHTLLKTCRLLQLGWLPLMEKPLIKNEKSIPKELADFIEQCSKLKGIPFVFAEVATDWQNACKDIKGGEVWRPLADALFADVFKRLCSYTAVKEWFQRRTFRVKAWDGFGHLDLQGQVFPKTKVQLTTNYENQSYWRIVEIPETSKAEARVEIQSAPFLKRWYKDDQPRKFEKVDCIPPGCVVEADVLNTWAGFRAEKLPAVPDDQVDELIQPIIGHFRNVVCATEEEVQFILAWKAQQVQHPGKKSEVGLIFSGPQGAGKTIEPLWYLESVLGRNVALQTGKIKSILGEHSTALQNKVLCLLDEANYEALKPYNDEIKNLMTGPTLDLNPKNKDAYTTRNLVNLILTTNNDKSVHLEAGDRRWAVFECSDSKKGDTAYFDELGKHLNDRTARAFYQFLLNFDLSDYGNFQAKRPHTQLYKEMKEGNLSVFNTFLSHECISYAGEKPLFSPAENEVGCATEKPESFLSGAMFDNLIKWAAGANFDTIGYTSTMFGKDFTQLMKKNDNGVTKKRGVLKGKSGWIYTIEWSKLEKCLRRHGLFNNSV
jgi:hypothetical protein